MLRCPLVGAPSCAALTWELPCGGCTALKLRVVAAADGVEEDDALARRTLLSRLRCPALALSQNRLPLAVAVDVSCSALPAAAGTKHGSADDATLLAILPV